MLATALKPANNAIAVPHGLAAYARGERPPRGRINDAASVVALVLINVLVEAGAAH